MKHDRFAYDVPFFVNDSLSPRTRAAMAAEVATCKRCADECDDYRAIRSALREIDAASPQPPPALLAQTLRRIEEARQPSRSGMYSRALRTIGAWWSASGPWGPAGVALASAFAIVLAFVLHGPTSRGVDNAIVLAPIATPQGAQAPSLGGFTAKTSVPGVAVPLKAPAPRLAAGVSGAASANAATASATGDAKAASARQLARNGSIGLIVGDVGATIARIDALAHAQFGAVTNLNDDVPAAAGVRHNAQLALSVPDGRFAATLAAVAGYGTVRSRTIATEDLTDRIVDSAARLRNLRREEIDLRKIMDRSGKIQDVLAVEQELANVRGQIETLDAEATSLHRRVAYATLNVDLSDDRTAPVVAPGAGSQLSDAWRGARELAWAFTLGLVARSFVLVAFAPFALVVAFVAVLLWRRLRVNR